jgi:hypothetical protein
MYPYACNEFVWVFQIVTQDTVNMVMGYYGLVDYDVSLGEYCNSYVFVMVLWLNGVC